MPLVSIGIPVYNGENYLKEALDSLVSQTYKNYEIIISDNASTDNTRDICLEFVNKYNNIRYYRNDINVGAAKNFNKVFQLSKGKYFKWAAHDDICDKRYIEKCIKSLENNGNVVLSFPRISYIDEKGEIINTCCDDFNIINKHPQNRLKKLIDFQIKGTDIFWAIFGLIRSDVLRKTSLLGSYNASDQILLLELVLHGDFYNYNEVLYFRREHPLASMTKHRTPKERLLWFDTSKNQRIVFSAWNLFIKHFSIINRYNFGFFKTFRCYYDVSRRFIKMWRTLGGEIKVVIRESFSAS